jgi:hypothetical protein
MNSSLPDLGLRLFIGPDLRARHEDNTIRFIDQGGVGGYGRDAPKGRGTAAD